MSQSSINQSSLPSTGHTDKTSKGFEREQRKLRKKLKNPTKNFKDIEELRKFLSNEIYNKVSQKNDSLIDKYSRWKMKDQAASYLDKYASLQSAEIIINDHERKAEKSKVNLLPSINNQ